MTKRVLLYSGGLDSTALWYLLNKPHPIYCPLGHRYEVLERMAIQHIARITEGSLYPELVFALKLGAYERDDAHIPYRNLLLASAAALRGADVIYLGALRGEASPDKTNAFARATSKALSEASGRRIRVEFPALHLTKTRLVHRFLQETDSVAYHALLASRSCYTNSRYEVGVVGCGRCQSCFRRWVAMSNNGIEERYARDPAGRWRFPDKRALARLLLSIPATRWPAVLENNLDAYRALRRTTCS